MPNERVLEDKVIVITGAGRGIGRDFALPAFKASLVPLERSRDVLSWDPI